MPNYTAYPKKKDTPSRNARKSQRAKVFLANYTAAAKIRKERRAARKAAREALESVEE